MTDLRILIIAALLFIGLTEVVIAAFGTIAVKDANGVARNYAVFIDGSGNYNGIYYLPDGYDVTQGSQADATYAGSGSASVVSVLKGIFNSITGPIAAGTNNIGFVTLNLQTSGGWTPLIANALTASAIAIKASAGQLGMLQCYNPNQAQAYIQIFNLAAASVVLGSTIPTLSIPIAPTATGGMALSNPGIQFNTAISIAATTTALGNTAPSTAIDCNTVFN